MATRRTVTITVQDLRVGDVIAGGAVCVPLDNGETMDFEGWLSTVRVIRP